jgi:hypothetical protein
MSMIGAASVAYHEETVMERGDDFADELAYDRLAHGYAVTVHRSQGATVDTAHHLHDGGGRELAYVAMSRARDRSTVYCVADTPAQARDDLRRGWSEQRRPAWVIDLDTERARLEAAAAKARALAEESVPSLEIPVDPRVELAHLDHQLRELNDDRQDAEAGLGRYQVTAVGHTHRHLENARRQRELAKQHAADPTLPRRMRRAASVDAVRWAEQEQQARVARDKALSPALERVDALIGDLRARRSQLVAEAVLYKNWLEAHPDIAAELDRAETKRIRDFVDQLLPRRDPPPLPGMPEAPDLFEHRHRGRDVPDVGIGL